MIKVVTQIGNPIIRSKAKPIRAFSLTTKTIVNNLIDSMRHYNLVGMAAPQIGIGKRIFVSEIRKTNARNPKGRDRVRIFINPNIVSRSKRQILGFEGCGSIACAGLFAKVKRSRSVVVDAYDENGKKFRIAADGLLARIIQHEFDHLNGKVFLDRLSNAEGIISREEYLKRFK